MSEYRCSVHEQYLESVKLLSDTVGILDTNVKWILKLGKFAVGTMLTLSLFVAGAIATFTYKASDAYAKLQVHEVLIMELYQEKE